MTQEEKEMAKVAVLTGILAIATIIVCTWDGMQYGTTRVFVVFLIGLVIYGVTGKIFPSKKT